MIHFKPIITNEAASYGFSQLLLNEMVSFKPVKSNLCCRLQLSDNGTQSIEFMVVINKSRFWNTSFNK